MSEDNTKKVLLLRVKRAKSVNRFLADLNAIFLGLCDGDRILLELLGYLQ